MSFKNLLGEHLNECRKLFKPHPNPLLSKERENKSCLPPKHPTVYTQVIESLPVLELPHPNPPLVKGRERDSLVSPLSKGGLRGVDLGCICKTEMLPSSCFTSKYTRQLEIAATQTKSPCADSRNLKRLLLAWCKMITPNIRGC
jgi:hypothetical protein